MRILMFTTAMALLASCQMQTPETQTTTREQRLAISQDVIDSCVATRCGLLNLDSKLVEDYTQIAGLTHVTALMASYSDFDDLGDIAAMSQLTELHLGRTQVRDLSGLSNFPNLTLLHVQGSFQDIDLSPIAGLTQLEELALGRNAVGDLGFLRAVRGLKILSLTGAEITSFSGLRRHPTLEVLDLTSADMPADLSALTTIPNLREIGVTEWNLTEDQKAIVEQLRASGVEVQYEVAVIVC